MQEERKITRITHRTPFSSQNCAAEYRSTNRKLCLLPLETKIHTAAMFRLIKRPLHWVHCIAFNTYSGK